MRPDLERPDLDKTVLMPQRGQRRGWRAGLWLGLGLAALAAGIGAGGWLMLRPLPSSIVADAPPPAPVVPVTPAEPAAPATPPVRVVSVPAPTRPPAAAAPAIPAVPADEAAILANQSGGITAFRFAPNPLIFVLDFAELGVQGRMFDRASALIELKGFPRDRVLTDAELGPAVKSGGATEYGFYLGYDFRMSDLERFFDLADRDGVTLNREEEWLRTLVKQETANPEGARSVISIPRIQPGVNAEARAVILRHELSHGEYFSKPAYAAYAGQFWREVMSVRERDVFRKWLSSENYDAALEDLMINETQAYLMHTRNPAFFSARALGMGSDELARLQVLFLTGMPPGWLRDCTPGPAGTAGTAPVAPSAPAPASPPVAVLPSTAARPASSPRYRRARVSTTVALPARRASRRRAASSAA